MSEQFQTPQQRGAALARSDALENTRRVYEGALGSLASATPGRDARQAMRDRYDRAHANAVAAAQRYAAAIGQPVRVPKWLPPPQTEEAFEMVSAPPVVPADDSHIRARKAAEKVANIRPGVPGSDAGEAWVNFQGANK